MSAKGREMEIQASLATLMRRWIDGLQDEVTRIDAYVASFEAERRPEDVGAIAVAVEDLARRSNELAAILRLIHKDARP